MKRRIALDLAHLTPNFKIIYDFSIRTFSIRDVVDKGQFDTFPFFWNLNSVLEQAEALFRNF